MAVIEHHHFLKSRESTQKGNQVTQDVPERRLIIRSRMAEGFTLSESGFKSVQHMLTDWLPRSLYFDLTEDTVRVDVEIQKSFTGKCAFNVTFLRYDASVIKKAEYMEESILGKVCKFFSPKNNRYIGKRDGFDHRSVSYTSDEPMLDKTIRIERK